MGRPKGAKQVLDEHRNIISEKNYIGVRQCHIAKHYKMPCSAVCSIKRRGRFIRATEKRRSKSKLSDRTQHVILSAAENNRFKPSCVIAGEYKKFSSLPICSRTVRKCYYKNGVHNCTASSKL